MEKAKTVKKVLSMGLYRDLQAVQKAFAACVTQDAEEGDSIDTRNITRAADTLAFARDVVRTVDEEYKEKTAKLKADLAPYDAERKIIKSLAESIDGRIDKCLTDLYNEGHINKVDGIDGRLSKLAVCIKPSATVVDAAMIPDEYLLPREKCIDMAKLEQARKDGVIVPGAGVHTAVSFRASIKEQIEV